MTFAAIHHMERKSRLARAAETVAEHLAGEMKGRGLTAKELSRAVGLATPYSLDYRTIQNAMGGTCSLDTFMILAAFFGWDFADIVLERRLGDRLASLERRIDQERAQMAALDARIAREREARKAGQAVAGGALRLVAPEDRAVAP
jgi:hypothetical protein